MSKKTLSIFVAVCAIIVGIVLIWYSGSEAAQGTAMISANSSRPTTTISKNVNDAKDRKRQDADRFANALSASLIQPKIIPTDAAELTMKELHEKTGSYFFDMAPEVLEGMFQRQQADTEWTSSVNKEALEVLQFEESKGTSLYKTDCRETLCKIQFDHENLDRHKSFMDGRMDTGSWMTGGGEALGSYTEQENDELRSFIYFTKPEDQDTFLEMRREMATILDSE